MYYFFNVTTQMIHRWMSARVKRGTNITGKADRSASVQSVTNKRKIAVGFYPPEKAKTREDLS